VYVHFPNVFTNVLAKAILKYEVCTPIAFTGDDISLIVGGGPFAPFVRAFVAFMSFANNNKL